MSQLVQVLLARDFAVASHGEQMYGDFPYIYHIEKVEQAGERFFCAALFKYLGATETQVRQVLLLHDTEEDSGIDRAKFREILKVVFGRFIADQVHALSDAPVEGNRKARKWGTDAHPGPMRLLQLYEYRTSLFCKLCDRIANREAAQAARDKLPDHKKRKKDMAAMYDKEYPEFREVLYKQGTPLEPVWAHLDKIHGWEG